MLFSKLLSHLSWQSPKPIFSFWMPANEAKEEVHECGAGASGKVSGAMTQERTILIAYPCQLLCWNGHSAQICRGYFVTIGKLRGLQRCQPWYYRCLPPKICICEKNSLHLHHCLEPTSLLSHAYCNGLRNHWTQKHLGLNPHSDIG